MATEQDALIQISKIPVETIRVPILGTSPLITHRFSEKARHTILAAQQGSKSPKENRDPEADYQRAFHRIKEDSDEYGFPAVGFKKATVSAARFFPSSVTMVGLRQVMFFHGEPGEDGSSLVRIVGEPRMREDVVRISRGSTDLRFRPEFPEWSATLEVTYVTISITKDSVLTLIDAGGMGVGIGEWRPEKGGDYGTYRIDITKDVEVLPA
jgi:hypothetical protein